MWIPIILWMVVTDVTTLAVASASFGLSLVGHAILAIDEKVGFSAKVSEKLGMSSQDARDDQHETFQISCDNTPEPHSAKALQSTSATATTHATSETTLGLGAGMSRSGPEQPEESGPEQPEEDSTQGKKI